MNIISRHIRRELVDALQQSRVVCLLGARQSGKTTLVRSVAQGEHSARYVTLDDPTTLDAARGDPTGFVARGARMVIDEVQRAPDLLLAIKRVVDLDNTPGQFLLTGSANILTLPRIADALPGRVEYLTLWPFTQGELIGHRESFLEAAFAGNAPEVQDAPVGRAPYVERIVAGGFPAVVNATPSHRLRFFASHVDSILGREIVDLTSIRAADAVGRMLRLAAARSASLMNLSALGRDVGVDHKTAANYLRALEQLFLVARLPAWHTNLGHRVVRAPKLHIADSGMLCALIGADARRLVDDDGLAGSAFETFAVTELIRQASCSSLAPLLRLHHWRDRHGHEVDLVIERGAGDVVGVEVKASATPRHRDSAGLRLLRDRLGERFRAGILLHLGPDTLPLGERLWAVPLAGIWGADGHITSAA